MEETKYNKSFLVMLTFSLVLMILHLFVIEISFIGDASSTVLEILSIKPYYLLLYF